MREQKQVFGPGNKASPTPEHQPPARPDSSGRSAIPLPSPLQSAALVEPGYKNLSYLFLIVLFLVGLGFFKTYFSLFPRFPGLPVVAHFHAAGLLLWFALLIVQPLLILNGKISLHRMLGKFSYVLVPYIALTVLGMVRESYLLKGMPWLLAG